MRITNQMMVNNAIKHMSDNLDRLNSLQQEMYTGKQFQNASDDPVRASMSLQLRSTLRATSDYQNTATLAKDWMSANEASIQGMEDLANRAINLVLTGLNDTMSGTERASALSTELTGIIDQAMDIGNTTYQGKYLFSGLTTDVPAFSMPDASTINSQPGGLMERTISPGTKVSININGNEALLPFMQSLVAARDALDQNNTDDLRNALGVMQSSLDTLDKYRTSNGARLRQIDSSMDYMDKTVTEINSLLSKKEDVNMAEAISLYQGQQTTYQAVLEVGNRAISALNLFDYLR